MRKALCLAVLIFASVLSAADISEKFAKKVGVAEEGYKAAVSKAESTRFYAVQKANQERTKALKLALAEATRAGDFDSAAEIKARMEPSLTETITATDWMSQKWGRFVFRNDGSMSIESWKGSAKWLAIDDNSVLVNSWDEKAFAIDRLIFNSDRTRVSAYHIGVQDTPTFEGERATAKK